MFEVQTPRTADPRQTFTLTFNSNPAVMFQVGRAIRYRRAALTSDRGAVDSSKSKKE